MAFNGYNLLILLLNGNFLFIPNENNKLFFIDHYIIMWNILIEIILDLI